MITDKIWTYTFLFIIILQGCSSNIFDNNVFIPPNKFENRGFGITSIGDLRTLIIYAVFPDDTLTSSHDRKFSRNKLPEWTSQMINNSKELNFPFDNLSKYFYEMSAGNLFIYGETFPSVIVTKHNQAIYKSIREVNYEILKRVDEEIDFRNYDSWSKDDMGKYVQKPDGKVDLIFIVYRNFENRLFFNNRWTGAAGLYLPEDFISNENIKISSGMLDKGSGIQSRGGRNGFTYMKYVLAHEFGHMLFGSGHIENVTNLALMTGGPVWNASRGMHSWEKNRIGWLDFIDIPLAKNSTIVMSDYHTTGEAYRIVLNKEEWYILENHQGISSNDWAKDKGLYIYHIKNSNKFPPEINLECADGNWDFEIDRLNSKLIRSVPNKYGNSELNFKKYIDRKTYACYEEYYLDNSAWGDEYDAFDLEYNNLFSPSSNPSSVNNNLNFAVEVTNHKNNQITANIWIDNIYENTPPSKPQIIDISYNLEQDCNLIWNKNDEPDIKEYRIYFYSGLDKKISKLTNINHDSKISQYSINISSHLSKDKINSFSITAVDMSDKESVLSDFIEMEWSMISGNWNVIRKENKYKKIKY